MKMLQNALSHNVRKEILDPSPDPDLHRQLMGSSPLKHKPVSPPTKLCCSFCVIQLINSHKNKLFSGGTNESAAQVDQELTEY